jgi:RNA polymerase sigma factor (sigma-70 family)
MANLFEWARHKKCWYRVNIGAADGSSRQTVTAETCRIISVQQLIDRCVVGEEQAWRDLHRQYYPLATRFLRRLGVGPSELDDACQEVFVQVFRYLARIERRTDFQTWLYKLCLSQVNRLCRRRKLNQALGWLLRRDPTVEPEWSESMAVKRMQQVLDRMKPIQREVFVLFELEGMEVAAIAQVLGCLPSAVSRR